MTTAEINIKLAKILEERNKFIQESLLSHGKTYADLEKKLFDLISKKYITQFQYKDNLLVLNEKNLRLVNNLDKVFNEFKAKYSDNAFLEIGNNMLSMDTYSKDYFNIVGMKDFQFKMIESKLDLLAQKIGIDTSGNIIRSSYLDYLAGAGQFREELKGYVIKSLAETHSLNKFQEGFSKIVEGDENMVSRLNGYWETETHDMYFKTLRATDDAFALTMQYNFFLYLPDEINTSRPFCKGGYDKKFDIEFESKIAKLFHREEVKEWINLEWSGKKWPYNPIIDMGGWNCRHQPSWVTNEMAEEVDPEKYNKWKDVEITTGEEVVE